MESQAPRMRNTHFSPENGDAQYALRNLHHVSTIPAMSAGEKIRSIRIAKEMTIAEVEARAGLTDGNLSRIERGKQWVSEDVLRKIAEALSSRVSEFFEDDVAPVDRGDYQHPAMSRLQMLLDEAGAEVRLLTVYRLASAEDRGVIDAAIDAAVERLDIIGILNKR